MVYGFHPASFAMTMRFGGYRPTVFMQHGLMVGMWMTCASLAGVWLWQTRSLRKVRNLPMWVLVCALLGTTVLCKSMGAIVLLMLGLAILYACRFIRSNVVLIVLLFITPAYMIVRAQGLWDGHQIIEIAASVSDERADSLRDRLGEEELLIARASERPVWGWGGFGRWRVKDEVTGEDLTSSDGMWIIVRGERGMVGLVTITLVLLLPFVLLLKRVPARQWGHPAYAGAVTLAMILMLWSIDNLFNAMHNPVYIIAAGGLSGFYIGYPAQMAAMRRAQQQQVAMMQLQQMRMVQEGRRRERAAQQAAGQLPQAARHG
jgi:hypothetical protein